MDRFICVELKSGAKNYFRLSAVTKFACGRDGTLSVHFLDGCLWIYDDPDDAKSILSLLKKLLVEESNP